MRRISMLLTVACSLAAQSDNGERKDFHKDLTKQKFNLRANVRIPKQLMVTPGHDTQACSIPLVPIIPPSKGKIKVIEPRTGSNMPLVNVPGAPCKDWPTE